MRANETVSDKPDLGPGQPDYGHNQPTGGTDANTNKIDPKGPSSGTANDRPEKRKQTTANHETIGTHTFRCLDAGYYNCEWETAMANNTQLWDEIERHHAAEHGTIDESSRGRIQNAVQVRRAA